MDGLFHLGKELHQQHAGDRSQSVFIKSKLAYHKTAFSSHRIGKALANPVAGESSSETALHRLLLLQRHVVELALIQPQRAPLATP